MLAGILGIFFLYNAAGILFQDAKDEYERYNDRLTVTVNKNGSSSLSADLNKKDNLYDYSFPELLKQRYMKERNKTESEYQLVQLALKDWFSIFAFNTNRTAFYDFPSKEVDELWHLFILFTKDYREFCQKYLGQFLDHVLQEEHDGKGSNYPNLKNLVRTYDAVKDKNDGVLFKIDDIFGINNKYNYKFMKELETVKCKSPKSRTVDEGTNLYLYGLISYSESREMIPKPAPEPYISSSSSSKSSGSSKSSSSSCGSSCGSSSSGSSSSSSSCGSSCGSGGGCGS